jgi:hypothetical protein
MELSNTGGMTSLIVVQQVNINVEHPEMAEGALLITRVWLVQEKLSEKWRLNPMMGRQNPPLEQWFQMEA